MHSLRLPIDLLDRFKCQADSSDGQNVTALIVEAMDCKAAEWSQEGSQGCEGVEGCASCAEGAEGAPGA